MLVPPSLLFGEGFYQDSEVFRINKSSLPLLIPSENNTAQSLLTAIVLSAINAFLEYLTTDDGELLTNDELEPLQNDVLGAYEYLNVSLWRVFLQRKYGVPVITHSVLFEVYASPLIPYEQPLKPSDLE